MHRPGREGFSLVEIMMVLMILAVGILPVAVIQHQARREVDESDMLHPGLTVAQSQLERIKGMGFGTRRPTRAWPAASTGPPG